MSRRNERYFRNMTYAIMEKLNPLIQSDETEDLIRQFVEARHKLLEIEANEVVTNLEPIDHDVQYIVSRLNARFQNESMYSILEEVFSYFASLYRKLFRHRQLLTRRKANGVSILHPYQQHSSCLQARPDPSTDRSREMDVSSYIMYKPPQYYDDFQ